MRHNPLSMAGAFLVSLFMYGAAISPAKADVVDFFKCSLAEGATMDEMVGVAEAFLVIAGENGQGDYSVRFMRPWYARDISPGAFFWVGVAPSFAAMGAVNDLWETDANEEVRARFGSLISGCESSSLHQIIRVGDEE